MLIGKTCEEKTKNDSKPNNVQSLGAESSCYCPLIIEFPPTTLLPHSLALPSPFSLWKNKVDEHTIGNMRHGKKTTNCLFESLE
jgi:hypothetical protein